VLENITPTTICDEINNNIFLKFGSICTCNLSSFNYSLFIEKKNDKELKTKIEEEKKKIQKEPLDDLH